MLPALLITLAVVLRILPHPPNLAPVGAIAIFAGRTLPRWAAIVLTLIAMLIGDAILAWIHHYPLLSVSTLFVYAGFTLQVLIGGWLRGIRGGALYAAFLGACGFFVLSNFGVWAEGWYGHSVAGLVTCYTMAVPFFSATLLGDLSWTVVLALVYRAVAPRIAKYHPQWIPRGLERAPVV